MPLSITHKKETGMGKFFERFPPTPKINITLTSRISGLTSGSDWKVIWYLRSWKNADLPRTNTFYITGLTPSEIYFQTALNYIQKNYTNNISISDIAATASIDRTYIFKLFQKYTKQSPSQYLQSFRLEKACVLLRKSSLCVTDTAYAVGFQQPAYFSKLFTQYKGITPSQYRKEFLQSYMQDY